MMYRAERVPIKGSFIAKPRKLEHGLRMISAGIPYALP